MKVVITEAAIAQLEDILVWTEQEFGHQQAARYRAHILDRLRKFEDGQALDKSLQTLTGSARHAPFRYIKTGELIAVLLHTDTVANVVAFAHGRSDLPNITLPRDV